MCQAITMCQNLLVFLLYASAGIQAGSLSAGYSDAESSDAGRSDGGSLGPSLKDMVRTKSGRFISLASGGQIRRDPVTDFPVQADVLSVASTDLGCGTLYRPKHVQGIMPRIATLKAQFWEPNGWLFWCTIQDYSGRSDFDRLAEAIHDHETRLEKVLDPATGQLQVPWRMKCPHHMSARPDGQTLQVKPTVQYTRGICVPSYSDESLGMSPEDKECSDQKREDCHMVSPEEITIRLVRLSMTPPPQEQAQIAQLDRDSASSTLASPLSFGSQHSAVCLQLDRGN